MENKTSTNDEAANIGNVLLADSKKFAYDEAYSIALVVLELLRPHCIRCEIAGSIRREKPEVKDIEIVLRFQYLLLSLWNDKVSCLFTRKRVVRFSQR